MVDDTAGRKEKRMHILCCADRASSGKRGWTSYGSTTLNAGEPPNRGNSTLLMVMTVRLLVYAALEHRIHNTLKQHGARVPNQKGKPTQRSTAKWVFELFLDVHLLTITTDADTLQTLVLNLQHELQALLVLLGRRYERLYF